MEYLLAIKLSDVRDLAIKYSTTVVNEKYPDLAQRISIDKLSSKYLAEIKQWPSVTDVKGGYGDWDWSAIYHDRKKSNFYNFSISLDGVIEGVVSCRLNQRDENVSIDLIQRKGLSNNLKGKVTPIAAIHASFIGYLMGFDTVSIDKPAPEIVAYYHGVLENAEFHYTTNGGQTINDVARITTSITNIINVSDEE